MLLLSPFIVAKKLLLYWWQRTWDSEHTLYCSKKVHGQGQRNEFVTVQLPREKLSFEGTRRTDTATGNTAADNLLGPRNCHQNPATGERETLRNFSNGRSSSDRPLQGNSRAQKSLEVSREKTRGQPGQAHFLPRELSPGLFPASAFLLGDQGIRQRKDKYARRL